jgi:hypothetical protein
MRVEPAVPTLIDALEKDERLTRSVHFWRDFARSRTVLSVREAEVTALMAILRVSVFEPVSTGDSLTARGDNAAIALAKQLRAYWKEYGKLPFDERMMKILTDAKTSFTAKREAADNLANLDKPRQYRTMFGPTILGGEPPPKWNPVIAKFAPRMTRLTVKKPSARPARSSMSSNVARRKGRSERSQPRTGLPSLAGTYQPSTSISSALHHTERTGTFTATRSAPTGSKRKFFISPSRYFWSSRLRGVLSSPCVLTRAAHKASTETAITLDLR